MNRIISILFVCLLQSALAAASTYNLRVEVVPSYAGTANQSSSTYEEGKSIYLYTSNNNGFVFKGWFENETMVSSSSSFYFTMPARDVVLTARYEYDPEVPANPDSLAMMYDLNVTAKPQGGGTFNISHISVPEGKKLTLYSYTNTGFKFLHWENEEGEIISTKQNMDYTMPKKDCRLYGVFEYNPDAPSNPSKNYWNKEEGQLIIDDFKAGSLASAIYEAIGNSNSSDVAVIIVDGCMTDNDFGVINNYDNCKVLDFSRVTGVTKVPSYAFDGTAVEHVYLPSTIEEIGTRAFSECEQLQSVTCYSMTPPVLGNYVFEDTPEGVIVYVPEISLPQYYEAEGWKDMVIMPIRENICNLTVNLPADADISDYYQMRLELVNTRNGMRKHYIMTDRQSYNFPGIIHNTNWNIQVCNESGNVFGRIDNVDVKEEDITVSFGSLLKPRKVSLKVLSPDGADMTSQVGITWMETDGKYISQQPELNGLVEGKELNYLITIPRSLAMQYKVPDAGKYVVKDGDNTVVCTLENIGPLVLEGRIVDDESGRPLSGITVSASQTFAGEYSNVVNSQTDSKGVYRFNLLNTSTKVTASANNYISNTFDCASLAGDAGSMQLPDIRLKEITGAVLRLGFTYQRSAADGEEPEVLDWYNDHENIQYAIFNKTKNREIAQFKVQYPKILLLEEVEDGDILQITAGSKKSAFKQVTCEVVVEEQKADVTVGIKELGRIEATVKESGNASDVAILYGTDGKIIGSHAYSNGSLTIKDIADGRYTMVSMGKTQFFTQVYDFDEYAKAGLVEGCDYVLQEIDIESGVIERVEIESIPFFDESKFYYTGDATSFTVNKTSIVSGNYLTLTANVDFKQEYQDKVTNVSLVVNIPEGCSFVDNSVMVGNGLGDYAIEGNNVVIPLQQFTDRVRFCIVPTRSGEYTPSASVAFVMDGEENRQPIGSVTYVAKDQEINVPNVFATTSIPISGVSQGGAYVEIFDNGIKIGETTSLANGTWSVMCELNDAYNLSTHNIFARITTRQGIVLETEAKQCLYDVNAVQVRKVTMYHWNPELRETQEVVFDFMNPSASAAQWTVYYPDKKFTYTIEFTAADPEKISNVVLYVHTADDRFVPCDATFDEKTGLWCAEIDMGRSSDGFYPVNCSVDFYAETEILMDRDEIDDCVNFVPDYQKEMKDLYAEIDALLEGLDDENSTDDEWNDAYSKVAQLLEIDMTCDEDEEFDMQKVMYECDSLLAACWPTDDLRDMDIYGKLEGLPDEFKDLVQVRTCEGLSEATLEGFEKIGMTDGTYIYIRETEERFEYVDFKNNIYYVVNNTSVAGNASAMRSARDNKDSDAWGKIQDSLDKIKEGVEESTGMEMEDLSEVTGTYMDTWDAWNEGSNKCFGKIMKRLREIAQEINNGDTELLGERAKLRSQLGLLRRRSANLKHILGYANYISKSAELISLGDLASDISEDVFDFKNLYNNNKLKGCGDDPNAKSLRNDLLLEATKVGAIYAAEILLDKGLSKLAPTLMGLAPGVGTAAMIGTTYILTKIGLSSKISNYRKRYADAAKDNLAKSIKGLKCGPQSETENKPGEHKSGTPDNNVKIDPSGYVYEGVSSNRVQGATATVYYKETVEDMYGDLHDNIVKWNAEEYGQKNPLITDENGFYRWDVPQGMWQVKYEKEGYETTYSEWLPVPPPQLEVNVPMIQNRQPEVKAVKAYTEGVVIEFDKYMQPATLNGKNIIVSQENTDVEGVIELLNEEIAYADENVRYASKVRFVPSTPFTAKEITLLVSNKVKSYADVNMNDYFQQAFKVEKEIKEIAVSDTIDVPYGGAAMVTVTVLPADASKGKVLHAATASAAIVSLEESDAVIGEDGTAQFALVGELMGASAITFSVEGSDIKATAYVKVVEPVDEMIEMPTASLPTGTSVYRGTEVTLSAASDEYSIWYTTDDSCPCDENGTRILYSDPIVIAADVNIKAIAENSYGEASEVATFVYRIMQSTAGVVLDKGWNWVAFNMKDSVLNNVNSALQSGVWAVGDEIKNNLYTDSYSNRQGRWVGTLSSNGRIENTGMYMIHSSVEQTLNLVGEAVNPMETDMPVGPGWNYIAYLPMGSLSVAEALADYSAQDDDVIKSQDAFAIYSSGNGWEGSLEKLYPGKGYMLKRADNAAAQTFKYPATVVKDAANARTAHHPYANNMNIVARATGVELHEGDSVIAYAGNGVRGCAIVGSTDNIFLTVSGDERSDISFSVLRNGEVIATSETPVSYEPNRVLGNTVKPKEIRFVQDGLTSRFHVPQSIVTDELTIYVNERDVRDFSVAIYNTGGLVIKEYSEHGMEGGCERTYRMTGLSSGVYLVKVTINGGANIIKIVKK